MLKKIINSLSLIFETANKERKLILKDDATVEIYIIFVALIYFFYSFVYSPEVFTKLPVAYVDNDQTTISHQIRRMLDDTESMSIAYDANSMEEAKKLFEDGKVNGIVVIPEKFSEKLQKSGGGPSIAVYCDASYMLYYDKSLQAITEALGAFTGALQLKQTMMSGVPMKEAIASSKPFNIIATPLYNLEEGYGIFIIPMVLIVALQTLQLTGMGVLFGTLRENNTFITHFAMARRSRFGYFFMTIGRSIPYLVISMLLLLLGILVVFHIFTIPQRGNLAEVIVFLIPVVLAITFLGMTLMSIFRNREDTIMLLTVFSIPALMMGGVSYPVVAFPMWIKILAFFFPSTIGVKGFLALSQAGASLNEIKDIYLQMWGLCLFYFVLAVWTNRRFLYWQNDIASNPAFNDANAVAAIPNDGNSLIESPEETIEEDDDLLEDVDWQPITTPELPPVAVVQEPATDDISIDDDHTQQAIIPTIDTIATTDTENAATEVIATNESIDAVIPTALEQEAPEPEPASTELTNAEVATTYAAAAPSIQPLPISETINSNPIDNTTIPLHNNRAIELLDPLKEMVSGYNVLMKRIGSSLSNKLQHIHADKLQTPPAYIAVPVLEALKYVTDTEELSNLYCNLLANAMDKDTAGNAHPSFVDIIKHLTPDEAKILQLFVDNKAIPYINALQITDKAKGTYQVIEEQHVHIIEDFDVELTYVDNIPFYLDNIKRLGIIAPPDGLSLSDDKQYYKLENCCLVRSLKKDTEQKGFEFGIQRSYFKPTAYGNGFIKGVMHNKQ